MFITYIMRNIVRLLQIQDRAERERETFSFGGDRYEVK